ncbi:ABC transporter ATP-binding protein [uncultured Paludibaculum sp.]|uniref:ABC transporter ATP-binding protein n=1 Tax=uncultured Paludibaculum sp. TaxID=1765020 RepID=UPI002AAC4AAC|nr:ABC transporter ATP-binding protein [uncultured Paludibaculum sp.]
MSLISLKHASKIFRHRRPRVVLRDRLRQWRSKPSTDGFYALRDISFDVQAKESVALVGSNGAGKSTLLSLVCGLAQPDEGTVEVHGSIAPLLELGSGFHSDLTGHENLYLNAAMLGMTKAQVRERYDSIVTFSEIGEFINEPLRTYSMGMSLRLAFAVAVHCDPALVIIDEVLAVGDSAFQRKCHDRIAGLRKEGKTLLCVSHSPGTVLQFCDRAIWLHQGRMVMDGAAAPVCEEYQKFMADPTQRPPFPPAAET